MANLKDTPITKADIEEYVNGYSDFAFEIFVLKELNSLGFSCEHAGTYEDPVTNKTREFDIRAKKVISDDLDCKTQIFLSVECKNLKDNFPLIVHCLPREENECQFNLICASAREKNEFRSNLLSASALPKIGDRAKSVRLSGDKSPYRKRQAVGKSLVQLGRRVHDRQLTGNDSEVFDKMSQALNASYDLIEEAHYAAGDGVNVISAVVPVIVVPDNRIWTVHYNHKGEIERGPTIEGNVEYYIDKSWNIIDFGPRWYNLSHLEIVQISHLSEMIKKYTQLKNLTSP
jgi:hypothetical protein